MRYRASLVVRWLTGADGLYARMDFRCEEAEFPMATRFANQLVVGTLRGSRARDRAFTDALRPKNNWMKPEDQYDISIIGEKWPTSARRLPQKGRQPPAPSKRAIEGAGEENVLAEDNITLFGCTVRPDGEACAADNPQQWVRTFAFAAQT